MTRRNWLVFAAMFIAAGALALTGCGGDDNGGLSPDDMARIETAEANAAAAAAAQMAAEAAQAEAEAEAAAEMAARMEAEAEAAAAMMAQEEAEAMAAAAYAAQMEAEADEATAVAAQMAAEATATAAVAAEAVAKSEASAAMAAQMEAEADLAIAEAALATAKADAEADAEAAATALMAANAAKTAAETALAVAQSEAMAAKEAEMAAEAARDAAMTAQMEAMAAQTAAETAKAIADSEAKAAKEAEMMANEAKMAAETAQKEAEDKAEMYKQAAADAETAKMAAEEERDKYKMMYEEATAIDTVGTTVGAAARAVAARIASVYSDATVSKLMRDDDGLSFEIKQGATVRLNQDDTADDMAPELDGWMGVALDDMGDGVMQEGVVYSDIEKPVTPFSSRYPYTVDMNGDPAQTGSRTYYYVRGIPQDTDLTDDDISAAIYISGDSSVDDKISITHSVSSSNMNQSVNQGGILRGTYDNVPGAYTCAAVASVTECRLTWTENGVKLAAGGAASHLLFQADNIETLIPDPDHLTFGVWMLSPDGPAAGGFIRTIAQANASKFRQMDMRSLTGNATYKGDATGYYATRDAGSAEATSGRFTATATLKANFDVVAGAVPEDAAPDSVEVNSGQPVGLDEDMNAVNLGETAITATPEDSAIATVRYFRPVVMPGVSFKGSTIDEFKDADGNMMDGWIVNLDGGKLYARDAMVSPPRAIADFEEAQDSARTAGESASLFQGMTSGTGGAYEWTGSWDATFHGNNRATTPTGIVGTFQATAGTAHPRNEEGAINVLTDDGFVGVLGSFGARKE